MKKLVIGAMAALTFVAAGAATVSVFHAAPAYAANAKSVLVQAKAAGRIGETIGGYLAIVAGASDAERNAMNEINIRRKSVYTDLAKQKGVSVDVIARLSGEKQLAKAASGAMIMDESGSWKPK